MPATRSKCCRKASTPPHALTASATCRAWSTPPDTPTTWLTSATFANTPPRSGVDDDAAATAGVEAAAGFGAVGGFAAALGVGAGFGADISRAAAGAGAALLPLAAFFRSLLMLWATVRMLASGAVTPRALARRM